jgi:hypothetical protein
LQHSVSCKRIQKFSHKNDTPLYYASSSTYYSLVLDLKSSSRLPVSRATKAVSNFWLRVQLSDPNQRAGLNNVLRSRI